MSRKRQRPKKNKSQRNTNVLRIIGGDWRSRKLPFIDAPGLRPTPDRIRETLFNWLQGKILGTNCLDLFAGSGALGLEALSRGAADVVFVEKNVSVAQQLMQNLHVLNAKAKVLQGDAFSSLKQINQPFDLIFLDPPYRQGLIEKSLQIIKERLLLVNHGLLYAEHEAELAIDWQAHGFVILKQAQAGQVQSVLLRLAGC